MGTRYSADILTPTTLSFVFLRNRMGYNAYSVDYATIHDSYDDAVNDFDIMETITEFTNTSTGLYEYDVAQIESPGTYFDKIFITPLQGGTQINFISSFYVATQAPSVDECIVTGILRYGNGEPVVSALIYAVPAGSPAISSTGYGISPNPTQAYSNENGSFEIILMRNTDFILTISSIGYRQKISVPDQGTYNLFSLSNITMNNSPLPTPVNPEW
jgi:hypothetical protein